MPCTKYLKSGDVVATSCCDGLKELKSVAIYIASVEMKMACDCINNHYSFVPCINPGYAVTLPGKCGVDVPYVDLNTDCDKKLAFPCRGTYLCISQFIVFIVSYLNVYRL
ncbi:non-specific lipid-transfer protein [Artemisia annua]|uniref:Non-specific lipid-transfer protein n=1 Tax=Artemisia annua TaxID=35608 RepID=A0A2U1Q9P5_ARTAN|nr:non-specific lipid-transfer protein [Artemisia annua]